MSVHVDLHTHSAASPDGGLQLRDYQAILASGVLDVVAVTDHNTIEQARSMQQALGEKIIVGEEITAREGEIIGLYLRTAVPAGLSAAETVRAIHKQQGLVYIPHPFETVRHGLPAAVLDSIADAVDIIEVWNGRAIFQDKTKPAQAWAQQWNVVRAASSDAHGKHGWGKIYSSVRSMPTRATLVALLSAGEYHTDSVGLLGVVYPKYNRLRKRLHP